MKKFILGISVFISMFLVVGCENKNDNVEKNESSTSTSTIVESKTPDESKIKVEKVEEKKVIEENDYERSFGNYQCNFKNTMQMAEYNGKLYYCNNDENKQSYGLYKSDLDGENVEILNNDKASYINIYKDKIYYINDLGDNNFEMVKVDLDGKSNRESQSNIVKLLIDDNKLMYIERGEEAGQGHLSGWKIHRLVVVDLNTNQELSRKIVGFNTPEIVDSETTISHSPSVEYYISVNGSNSETFNTDTSRSHNIEFIGKCNEDSVLRIGGFTEGLYNNEIYLYSKADNTVNLLLGNTISSVLAFGDYVFYFDGRTFKVKNVRTLEEKSYGQYSNSESEMFVFDDMFYIMGENHLIPAYDLKENNITNEFKNMLSEQVEMTSDEARNLIMEADGIYINSYLSKYPELELALCHNVSYEEMKRLLNSWKMADEKDSEELIMFELTEGECYIVGKRSKNVYKIPHQGGMPAYLMKNNEIVKTYMQSLE